MRRSRVLLATVSASLLVAACGPSSESASRRLDDAAVPFGLLNPDDPTTTVSTVVAPFTTTIYLVTSDQRLMPVERPVSELAVGAVVSRLSAEVTPDDSAAGLRTVLASDGGEPLVTNTGLQGGVVTVDLGPAFLDLDGTTQVLALGQLVLTLTSLPGVGQVAFTVEGIPAEVPRADGTSTSDPLVRDDFISAIRGLTSR